MAIAVVVSLVVTVPLAAKPVQVAVPRLAARPVAAAAAGPLDPPLRAGIVAPDAAVMHVPSPPPAIPLLHSIPYPDTHSLSHPQDPTTPQTPNPSPTPANDSIKPSPSLLHRLLHALQGDFTHTDPRTRISVYVLTAWEGG